MPVHRCLHFIVPTEFTLCTRITLVGLSRARGCFYLPAARLARYPFKSACALPLSFVNGSNFSFKSIVPKGALDKPSARLFSTRFRSELDSWRFLPLELYIINKLTLNKLDRCLAEPWRIRMVAL